MKIRPGSPSDFDIIKPLMNGWWGGRQVDHLQHELFFDHFTDTVFVAENDEGETIGFINGFYSQSQSPVAYIHFSGVHPDYRGKGIGKSLYLKFFEKVKSDGRTIVKATTSPTNESSIHFHEVMGFRTQKDHRGKIVFEKDIA